MLFRVEGARLTERDLLRVHGWVISLAPIQDVRVFVDDDLLGTAETEIPRADVGAVYPDYPGSAMAGFALEQTISHDVLGGRPIRVAFRTRDLESREVVVPVTTTPAGAEAWGQPDAPSSPYPALSPMQVQLEETRVNDQGVLRVRGWAVSLAPVAAVQVFLDDRLLGNAQKDLSREDVGLALPDYPDAKNSGFLLVQELDDSQLLGGMVRVVVAAVGGVTREATRSLEVAPVVKRRKYRDASIRLECDALVLSADGTLSVNGWAVCESGIESIRIELNDDHVGDAEVGLDRPDVGNHFPLIPSARRSGFSFTGKVTERCEGEHVVTLMLRGTSGEERSVPLPVRALSAVPTGSHESRADPHEFRLELDHPVIIDGVVPEPVSGRLVIEGWALAQSGVEAIDVFLDGRILGQAYYGTARRDVEAAFPDWTNSLRSGYIFHCPPHTLESGTHAVRLQLRAKNGRTFESEFQIDVQQGQDSEDFATIRRRMSRAEIDLYQDVLDRLKCCPRFHLLLAARSPVVPKKIEATLRALAGQAYRGWQLAIVTDAAEAADLLAIADRAGVRDQVTNMPADAALDALVPPSASGVSRLVGVLAPGDELGCDALAEIAVARGLHAEAQFFYADEDRVSPSSGVREPFFKPAWSPDLLLSTNYIGRPWFATADLLAQAGITPQSLLGQQGDYDAVLRCTELASHIHHLPKLLCRRDDADTPEQEGERHVLAAAAARRGIQAELLPGCVPGTWRLKRTAPIKGKVSIIIPTCAAQGYVATCLRTLRATTAYRDFEIICIDNIPPDLPEWKELIRKGSDKVVDIPEAFNWSRFNNLAAEEAEGEYLLFLNDDIEVQQKDWLDALLEHARRPEVGVVGPQLLYPDRKVQHAGVFLTTLGAGRHSFRFLAEDDPGYFGLALTQRNVIAVTGACILMRRDVFERIGRFDEAHEVINNDVDCCLRIWRAGLSVVYTPYAQLIHHELASRSKIKDIFDAGHFGKQWRTLYASGDPFFSPRLTKFADEYRPTPSRRG